MFFKYKADNKSISLCIDSTLSQITINDAIQWMASEM